MDIFTRHQVEDMEEEEEDFSISENLDDNGFPIFTPLSESESEQAAPGAAAEEADERDGSSASVDESFASDFYSSGTDWSCLMEKSSNKRKLVQANLFHMWGFKKPNQPKSTSPPSKKIDPVINGDRDLLAQKTPRFGKSNIPRNQFDGRKRVCPFYKKIPGTPFTVDAFRYGCIEGCSAYFLSHFHYDHYGGLSKGWSHGPIYCTPLTGCLVKMCLSVNPQYICPLELDTEYVIEGIKVTMLDANHCPGAAMIHFRLGDEQCYLHTGDFRACKLMQSHSILINHRVNVLYLDTTYCNPKYRFPSKEDVLDFVVKVCMRSLAKQPKTLIVVGAYSIGKEPVYLAISESLGIQIFANASRRRILQHFDRPEISTRLCSLGHITPLHVLPISSLRPETLKQYLKSYKQQFSSVLAFRPTGWTYNESIGNQLDLIRPVIKGNITIYGVPYSEHSSFLELGEFVQPKCENDTGTGQQWINLQRGSNRRITEFLKPDKIIPTVNVGSAANRQKMQSYFREWLKS